MSWLAAFGPCASPKGKAKSQNKGQSNSLESPLNLASLKRQGSLTEIRSSRKNSDGKSFRERLQETFDGSLRKAKKAGSLENVKTQKAHSFSTSDHKQNPMAFSRGHNSVPQSPTAGSGRTYNTSVTAMSGNQSNQEPVVNTDDKFWTNFYNTLPRNRTRDRPRDLTLDHNGTLPPTSVSTGTTTEPEPTSGQSVQSGQWSAYATSPRTKRKNKALERMNSAPTRQRSPMAEIEVEHSPVPRPGSAEQSRRSPQFFGPEEVFDNVSNDSVMALPRSTSLQDEYWMQSKGLVKADRLVLGDITASPIAVPGHVWVKSRDGSHLELKAIERYPDRRGMSELPSPTPSSTTDSLATDVSSLTRSTSSASNHINPDLDGFQRLSNSENKPQGFANTTTQTLDQGYSLPYMSPEEYQANIFDLIQSLNQSPPNLASPIEDRHGPPSSEFRGAPNGGECPRKYTSEKFIVLSSKDKEALGTNPVESGMAVGIMEGDNYVIREQPIFTTRAHVFQIDPETKKNWVPASKQSVTVSYYYDSARNTYRIISVEGSKAIINSTITPNMTFTKTSQKFGQWSDPRANTVYGLGFGTETDLAKFIEKFKEVKDLTRQQIAQTSQVNGTSEDGHVTPQRDGSSHPARNFFHTRSSSLTSMQQADQSPRENTTNLRERRNSFNTPVTNSNQAPQQGPNEGQLKYENDRLKLALAQSSANAKKWEIELQTLKNNNARLTAALQESTANVEEWKKQLAAYKEESSRMKKKVMDMEKRPGSADQVTSMQMDIDRLSESVQSLRQENQEKTEEVSRLEKRLSEMQAKESANAGLQGKVKSLEEENRSLSIKVQDLQELLGDHRRAQNQETQDLLHLQDQLGNKITELYEFHEQIVSTIRKESTS